MNIANSKQKIKSLAVVIVFLFVSFGSFGLGRFSALNEKGGGGLGQKPEQKEERAGVFIEKTPVRTPQTASVARTSGPKTYVASKNGTKYYLTTCSGVSRIKEENKIYFDSEAAALTAGYDPSSTCKELQGK